MSNLMRKPKAYAKPKVLIHMSNFIRKLKPYAKPKVQISFTVTAKLISTFVFATQIVQFLYFLNPKFLASNHHLCLYSQVVPDLFADHIVGFLIMWLICINFLAMPKMKGVELRKHVFFLQVF